MPSSSLENAIHRLSNVKTSLSSWWLYTKWLDGVDVRAIVHTWRHTVLWCMMICYNNTQKSQRSSTKCNKCGHFASLWRSNNPWKNLVCFQCKRTMDHCHHLKIMSWWEGGGNWGFHSSNYIICKWRSAACCASSFIIASSKNLLMLTSSLMPWKMGKHTLILQSV